MAIPRIITVSLSPEIARRFELSMTPSNQLIIMSCWNIDNATSEQERQTMEILQDVLLQHGIACEIADLEGIALGDGADAMSAARSLTRKYMAAGNTN